MVSALSIIPVSLSYCMVTIPSNKIFKKRRGGGYDNDVHVLFHIKDCFLKPKYHKSLFCFLSCFVSFFTVPSVSFYVHF